MRLYDLRKRTATTPRLPGRVESAGWAPSSALLGVCVVGGPGAAAGERRILAYRPADGAVLGSVRTGQTDDLFWSWLGDHAVVFGESGTDALVRAPAPGATARGGDKTLRSPPPDRTGVTRISASPDGRHLLVVTDHLYDAPPGKKPVAIAVPFGNLPAAEFAWSPDGRRFAFRAASFVTEVADPNAVVGDASYRFGTGEPDGRGGWALRFLTRHDDLMFTGGAELVGWAGTGHLLVGRRAVSGPRYRLTAYEVDGADRIELVALAAPPRGIAWMPRA